MLVLIGLGLFLRPYQEKLILELKFFDFLSWPAWLMEWQMGGLTKRAKKHDIMRNGFGRTKRMSRKQVINEFILLLLS